MSKKREGIVILGYERKSMTIRFSRSSASPRFFFLEKILDLCSEREREIKMDRATPLSPLSPAEIERKAFALTYPSRYERDPAKISQR